VTSVVHPNGTYIEQFRRAGEAPSGTGGVPGGPSACAELAEVKQAALDRFVELGFPTMRHEDWRFTNTARIAETAFQLAGPGSTAFDATFTAFMAAQTLDADWPRLVLVNGYYCAELSCTKGLPDSIHAGSLAASTSGAIEAHLTRHAQWKTQPFTALNTAFLSDGAIVHVAAGTDCPQPIHVVYVSTPGADPQVSHPRGLIVVEAGSRVTVIESYVGPGGGDYFTNAVTEIVAGDNTTVDHYKIVLEHDRAYHVGTTHIHQGRDSSVTSHSVTLAGALVRNDLIAEIDGEGAVCTLNGLYITRDRSHVDNHLRVEHLKPHGDSRQHYKGILDGHSHAVFTGRINVHKDAQKTDAKQTNKNLLLSEDAQIDTKPQLEIFADDVKCTHGATIGQLDEDAIFYLRSRGIREDAARGVLLLAFAQESVDKVRPAPLRSRLQDAVCELLGQGRVLQEAI